MWFMCGPSHLIKVSILSQIEAAFSKWNSPCQKMFPYQWENVLYNNYSLIYMKTSETTQDHIIRSREFLNAFYLCWGSTLVHDLSMFPLPKCKIEGKI